MKNEKHLKLYLYLTVFTTGAVILLIEILGTRIIAPYYGNTVFVWSSLISVAILSLAFGYFYGGLLADKYNPSKSLFTIITLTGLACLIIPYVDGFVLKISSNLGVRFGAFVSAGVLFSVPLTLLGMVTPFAIKLVVEKVENVAAVTGRIYAISTLGSFIGVLVTGFFLIPSFGIRVILILTGMILFIIASGWGIISGTKKPIISLVVILFIAIIVEPAKSFPVVYEKQSLMGRISVVDRYPHRILLVEGSPQAWVEKDTLTPATGFTQLSKFAYFINPNIKNVLTVGLGSGALAMDLERRFGVNVEAVEIDPIVVSAARKFFNFTGKVHISDGRSFIRTAKKKYDAMILDMTVGDGAPIHFFSVESFKEAKLALTDGGVFIIHVIGSFDSQKGHSVYKTLKQAFRNVAVIPTGASFTSSATFFASDTLFDKARMKEVIRKSIDIDAEAMTYINVLEQKWQEDSWGGLVITDDYNPMDVWQIESMEAWRQYDIDEFGQYSL